MKTFIRAFSLFETVVSLLVITVVISVIYVIFELLIISIDNIHTEQKKTTDIVRLHSLISNDVYRKRFMYRKEDRIIFHEYDGDTISYHFESDIIVRMQSILLDTFHLPNSRIIIDTVEKINKKNLYSRIQLNFKQESDSLHFVFYRKINPDCILNQTNEFKNK